MVLVLVAGASSVVLLAGCVVLGRRSRRGLGQRDGSPVHDVTPHDVDGRAAANRNAWMLGGGGLT
jgi:hypothetical protein